VVFFFFFVLFLFFPGWAEQDPEMWWKDLGIILRDGSEAVRLTRNRDVIQRVKFN
jgi:hypothetical protein